MGPHALNIISDVHAVQHLAELGVVFLLFNIGLELSLERLQSMAKYVFGMGAAQVVMTLLGVALFAVNLAGLPGPSAIILGGALAMSTTAVAIQVLEDRGEMGSRCVTDFHKVLWMLLCPGIVLCWMCHDLLVVLSMVMFSTLPAHLLAMY